MPLDQPEPLGGPSPELCLNEELSEHTAHPPGLSSRLKGKKIVPASGTLEPPQSASRRVTAAGHRPTGVGYAPTAVG